MLTFATPVARTSARKNPNLHKETSIQRRFYQCRASLSLNDRLSNIQLPRNTRTTAEVFQDARGITWNFDMEVIESSVSYVKDVERSPVVLVHPPDSLGTSRYYWDRVLYVLSNNPSMLSYHSIIRFDWIGSSGTTSALEKTPSPTTAAILSAQLALIASKFEKPVIVVAHGSAEPIALTFAHQYPNLVKTCLVTNGLSTAFLMRRVNPLLRRAIYGFLCSFLGRLFWNYASSEKFITSFSKKNLFRNDDWLDEWISRVLDSSSNARTRFLTFSGLSGYFFGDYKKELTEIRTPWFFLAGDADPTKASNRLQRPGDITRLQSKRERTKETHLDRMNKRCSLMKNCEGVVVSGGGVQLVFEDTEITLRKIVEIIDRL